MNKQQSKAFADQFNDSFSPPFLPEGFVKCSIFDYKDIISIIFDIGDRNVAFKVSEEGIRWYAQDTKCDPDWLIERVKQTEKQTEKQNEQRNKT